jgi:hypothetical protein
MNLKSLFRFRRLHEHRNKKRARKALRLLMHVEYAQLRAGWSRQRRQQWWREFVNSDKRRMAVFSDIDRQTR